jgi:mercuric ion transport protein
MEKGTVATGGALGGGALGTALVFLTGCLETKVLLFLGISSGALSSLGALEPYRPVLLGVGIVALAVGVWRIARRRRDAAPVCA